MVGGTNGGKWIGIGQGDLEIGGGCAEQCSGGRGASPPHRGGWGMGGVGTKTAWYPVGRPMPDSPTWCRRVSTLGDDEMSKTKTAPTAPTATPTQPESLGQPQPASIGVERVLDEQTREAVELSATADQILETAQVDEREVFALFDAMSNSTADFRARLADLRIGDRDTCRSYLMRWGCARYGLTTRDGQRGEMFDEAPYAASLVAQAVKDGALADPGFKGDAVLGMMTIQAACAEKAKTHVKTASQAVLRAMNMLFDPVERVASGGKPKADEVAALMKRIVKLETESLDRLKAEIDKLDRTRASSK